MNNNLQILKSTLNGSSVSYSGDKHTKAQIKETDPTADLKKINLNAENGDWFIFNPEKGQGNKKIMSPLLAVGPSHKHHKACDAVIIALVNDILQLVFIELKSTSPSGFTVQFQSTRQFTKYLLGLLKEFYDISFNCEERFILFHTPIAKKRLLAKTRTCLNLKKSSDPKKPHKELIQDGATIYLKQLLN